MSGELDLAKLKAIAQKATQGEWRVQDGAWPHLGALVVDEYVPASDSPGLAVVNRIGENADANAAHIAAFDPPTVLALIEAAEQRDALIEQLATREKSQLERDMQEIMAINNALLAERDTVRAGNDLLRRANQHFADHMEIIAGENAGRPTYPALTAERDALQSRLAALEAVLPDLTRLPVEIDERALEEAAEALAGWRWKLNNEKYEDQKRARDLWRNDARTAITAYGRALVEGE